METSLKTGFAQIFSCCPKNLSCPNFGEAAAPLAPPARTPMLPKKCKILSWARDNLMTINLTKTKEMVVKGKVERPLPTVTFDINQEEFLKLLGVCLHSNPTNRDKQIDALLSKAGRRIHILRVCKTPGYSLDFLQHLFHSLIIPIFTYSILVWSVARYDKYLSKIDKFRKEQFVLVSSFYRGSVSSVGRAC